jgi:manganese/zinc/iron transport system ATP- binding protein
MNKGSAIEINDLTVAYKDNPVLWDIDLKVPSGVIMGIAGPNGAGKSTLIKTVINLVKPIAGKIQLLGDNYDNVRKKVAYVPQRSSVDWDFPATVFDVVMMGTYGQLGWFKRPGKVHKALVFDALERVGMEEYATRQISQLSGGQQQRTFIARALVQNAEIFLLDEPFAGIDAKTEKSIMNIFHELKDEGKTIVAVHHELVTLKDYFDMLAILNVKLYACGKVEDVYRKEIIYEAYGGHFNFAKNESIFE